MGIMVNDPQKYLEPTALDGSPAQAFASHKARANGIAKYLALSPPLGPLGPLGAINGTADEDKTTALIAHLHAASDDPDFAVPGQEASRTLAPKVLKRLNRGDGKVGTGGNYDFALKGLMPIAYRYRHLLSDDDFNFILDELVPADISGGHPPEIEFFEVPVLNIGIPETENHLLMIESSRYLVNQLLHDRTGDSKYDNSANGLSSWLLGYMQTIAKHDFLEFNARPYARAALHPLYNLHEFAREEPIRTAAQILLDYAMVKFAVSSNRERRVSPYRRLQPRINHQANARNDLYANQGDEVAGYFMAYTGFIDSEGRPGRFPESLTYNALISGTAAYRPPPAAYILAMNRDNPASLHRFYHGTRPQLSGSSDIADGGLEIYYRSPSFLLSAGGMFLNSGYGYDEYGWSDKKIAWRDTSRAQATTLIPTRADTRFADLIRFEPYPDPFVDPYVHDPSNDDDKADSLRTLSVNIGVHRGLAAGANLRPAEKKTILEHSTSSTPVLALHTDRLLIAWKGSGNDNLNVAKVQETSLRAGSSPELWIDGVEGVEEKVTLADTDTTESSPALASHNGRLFLAWKGSGNNQLNLACSGDNGKTFKGKMTLAESSKHAPALTSHAGRLFLAWTGEGEEKLNVAQVVAFANTAGDCGIEGLEGKVVLGDSSEAAPALASHTGRLFLAWKGSGNDNLNLAFSEDNGASFRGKTTLAETSSDGPSLTSHAGRLFLAWKGSGNKNLNVAQVVLFANTAGGLGIEGLEGKVVLGETSTEPPALASHNGRLFLAWKREGDEKLNLRLSGDGAFQEAGPWFFSNLEHLGFFVAAYRTPPARPDPLDTLLDNLALVYAMEAGGMDFNRFRELTLARNSGLPAKLDYGGVYEFHAPDDKRFSIWFQLSEQKYQARIVDLNEPNSVDDLSTLPLVSGEYMKAPGGHDGLIEIRHPGCTTPLVLDFRNTQAPVRLDNTATCLQWLQDLAEAYMTLSEGEWAAGDQAAALANSEEAFTIYRQLTQNDLGNYGPRFVYWLNLRSGHQRVVPALLAGAKADAEEAVKICQHLVQINQVEYQQDLAEVYMTLSEGEWAARDQAAALANSEEAARDQTAALANSEEAFTIYRQLTQNDPEKYGLCFVKWLKLRSGHQRVVPALLAGAKADAEEAVRICQHLVQINQVEYQQDLAEALANLDLVLSTR
jgi:hypothetical protein